MAVNFSITDIRLHSLHYSITKAKHTANQKVIVKADFKYQSSHDEQKQEYRTILGAYVYGEYIPYTLNIEIIGTFLFDSPPNEEEEQLFITTSCPTILFPYLREIVSDTIQRAGYPPFYLEPINFHDIYLKSQTENIQESGTIEKEQEQLTTG